MLCQQRRGFLRLSNRTDECDGQGISLKKKEYMCTDRVSPICLPASGCKVREIQTKANAAAEGAAMSMSWLAMCPATRYLQPCNQYWAFNSLRRYSTGVMTVKGLSTCGLHVLFVLLSCPISYRVKVRYSVAFVSSAKGPIPQWSWRS